MRTVLYLFLFAFLTGCAAYRPVKRDLARNPLYTDHFTGFALYDWEKQQTVVQHNADKYFTPASNTKLFSLYAGLVSLKDSVPALRYQQRGDSLIIWGTGNAAFLNPDLTDTAALAFLRNRPERIFLSAANYSGPRFGSGWAWDDYNDDYSAEVTPFPIFGNVVRFSVADRVTRVNASPALFRDSLVAGDPRSTGIQRDEFGNRFRQGAVLKPGVRDVPFRWSPELAAQLLADTLNRPVGVANLPLNRAARTFYSIPADSLYKRMMLVSDNLLAEHLVLLAANGRDTLNTKASIRFIVKNHLKDLPDRPVWVDGSGLSRYNLFTPRSIVVLLQKIYRTVPQDRLFNILSAGGRTGNLRSGYKADKPFIYAKSGSMSGVYNLSGYLITRKGKLMLFSMMHNNFTATVSEMRKRTEAFLTELHQRY
ncbi:D-alanyl-D-alanine carboxypeptidase/D-alanyl-D-alanine-endopeptidase [Tellurirhabdus rosea]|uniref:D-alanyl-D-alanine carboxypeptidase/D-alanyl-D-alanine-endopeptidase n=1 Tax=Tellurirhabdus rosea TaxID=2674997 RepID=UPI00225255D3|nr:D-alanyl-D-alanine carboxypeptidase [Tellurirhabdus rosea]